MSMTEIIMLLCVGLLSLAFHNIFFFSKTPNGYRKFLQTILYCEQMASSNPEKPGNSSR